MSDLLGRAVVTVDGLAGTGKSSLSAALAKELGFIHFNSGIVYRALGWFALNQGVEPGEESGLVRLLGAHRLELDGDAELRPFVRVDGIAVNVDLDVQEVADAASKLAQFKEVRDILRPVQQTAFLGRPLVAEGRDMGTVVFPDAPVKFFVEVPDTIRAERRCQQLRAKGIEVELAEVLRQITERDNRDSQRAFGPTVSAQDAFIIDNSGGNGLTFQGVVAQMAEKCRSLGVGLPGEIP